MIINVTMTKNLPVLFWKIIAVLISWPEIQNAKISEQYFPDLRFTRPYSADLKYYNSLNKVSMTQKGYIQFLRYIADVPTITEFTFCIWLRSNNLTYAHPLLSYSKHEEDRYIRAWISSYGKEINLAILENEVFKIPTYFKENRWYHICTSWDSQLGSWSFYLNGKLKNSGHEPKLQGMKIPSGGDIVVGQEYTDFDKGLDDGIEGDIFGFNMVLASTTVFHEVSNNYLLPHEFSDRRISLYSGNPYPRPLRHPQNSYVTRERHGDYDEIPSVLSYFDTKPNRSPKSIDTFFQSLLQLFEPERRIRVTTIDEYNAEGNRRYQYLKNIYEHSLSAINKANKRILNDITDVSSKPLGLQLVELSHNCAFGKGAPINHEKVLISWTKTPVRVFGGAILKNVSPFCYNVNL